MASLGCEVIMIRKQVLEFVVSHWKEILIVVLAIAVVAKTRYDYNLMQKTYKTQIESAQSQIEGLKEIHKQEIKEKQLLMESHLESIAEIEKDYEDALDMIDELRQDKAGKYRNKFNSDREELIKDIESKFGIEYVP
jgi:predicted secreted acid phosphatase